MASVVASWEEPRGPNNDMEIGRETLVKRQQDDLRDSHVSRISALLCILRQGGEGSESPSKQDG